MSIIALFVALGGVSYGLAGRNTGASDDIINGAVKSKDIKNSGVKSKDIRTAGVKAIDVAKDSLGGAEIIENTLGKVPSANNADHADNADNADNATNADNADNATNLGGSPASAFAPSTVVRWATVAANGTIVATDSQGITQANVTKTGTGSYCISGLSPAPTGATVSRRFGGTFGEMFAETEPTSYCANSQVDIATYNDSNVSTDNAFVVVVY